MHGHIETLLEKHVDAIFYPCLTYNIKGKEKTDNNYNCPVVAYYSEVLKGNMDSLKKVKFLYPYLYLNNKKELTRELYKCLSSNFSEIKMADVSKAVNKGLNAYTQFMENIQKEGLNYINYARSHSKRIMVLAGRPYHIDPGISQGIDQLIESLGFVVVTEDCVSSLAESKPVKVLNQWIYHSRLYRAAEYVANQKDFEMVQLVSFGCGLDAITTDEVRSILEKKDKLYTQIKIDEISNLGAARIRLRSLLGALEEREIAKRK
jgi:predicted nucleotide-binding protein (sugar kinase/HSP70/actin superfamily)